MRLPNWVVVYWPFGRSSRNAMNSWLFRCYKFFVAFVIVQKPTHSWCCCCCYCQCTVHSRAIIATISSSLVARKNIFSCLLHRFCCFIFLQQHFAVVAMNYLVFGRSVTTLPLLQHRLFVATKHRRTSCLQRSLDVSADCVAAAAAVCCMLQHGWLAVSADDVFHQQRCKCLPSSSSSSTVLLANNYNNYNCEN